MSTFTRMAFLFKYIFSLQISKAGHVLLASGQAVGDKGVWRPYIMYGFNWLNQNLISLRTEYSLSLGKS